MSIILVHAPTDDSPSLFRGAPMSLLYAMAVWYEHLRHGDYPPFGPRDVQLMDPALHPETARANIDRLVVDVIRKKPSLLAISVSSYSYGWAVKFVRALRAARLQCPVVIGGPHEDEFGSRGPGASIDEYGDLIDFAISGDGEHLFATLFKLLYHHAFDAGAVKGVMAADGSALISAQGFGEVSFRYQDETISLRTNDVYQPGLALRSVRSLALDELPIPPRELLSAEHERLFSVFKRRDGSPKRTAQVLTHRGCPYLCSFCTERGGYAGRGIAGILKELQTLRSDGYEAVFFDDSTLHMYRHLSELLNRLIDCRDDLGLELGGLTRVDAIAKCAAAPIEAFESAGFSYLYLGLEHYDDGVLRAIRKGYTVRDIDRCFDLIAGTSLRIGVSLLFGVDAETESSIRRTLSFIASQPQIVLVNLSVYALHPACSRSLRFDLEPPHRHSAWRLFEEGAWYHPGHADSDEYALRIHELIHEEDTRSAGALIPKLKRRAELSSPRRLPAIPTLGSVKIAG